MNTRQLLRNIPSVDRVVAEPEVAALLESYPRVLVIESIRQALDELRSEILAGKADVDVGISAVTRLVLERVAQAAFPSLSPAVNATGIVLHTGLGRAVLPSAAREAVSSVAGGHSTLEIDRETGRRGSRQSHVEPLLKSLTGSEAAMAVNNNAAAVFLAINALAAGREVVISRGQLVEIGGSFRIPDIIERAGCRLVEVGTTNRTRISDYANALTDDTALILRIHPSNFRVVGFSEEAALDELVDLGRSKGVPVMDDLGSGALVDLSGFGLKDEPPVQESVKTGCDIVTFSGDKLLGGPQAGLIVGKTGAVDECRRNPIARVVRLDKLTLAALEATLELYRDPEHITETIPTLRALARASEDVKVQAEELAGSIRQVVDGGMEVEVAQCESQVGGGSLPGQSLASWAVTLRSSEYSADDLSRHFRLNSTPIFGRIENDLFMLDLRTVAPAEAVLIVECVRDLVRR